MLNACGLEYVRHFRYLKAEDNSTLCNSNMDTGLSDFMPRHCILEFFEVAMSFIKPTLKASLFKLIIKEEEEMSQAVSDMKDDIKYQAGGLEKQDKHLVKVLNMLWPACVQ